MRSLGAVFLTNQRVFSYSGGAEVRASFIRDVDTVAVAKGGIGWLLGLGALLVAGAAFVYPGSPELAALLGVGAVIVFVLFFVFKNYELKMYVSGREQVVDSRIARVANDYDEIVNYFTQIKMGVIK